MTHPALLSLAALIVIAVPASAARCPGLDAAKDKILLPSGEWSEDLGVKNPACSDAVWRVAGSEGVKAEWDKAADVTAQKALLGKIAAVLEKYDAHTAEGIAAAKAVYEEGVKAGIVGKLAPGVGTIAGKKYDALGIEKAADMTLKPTGDVDKDALAASARSQSLLKLFVPGVTPQATNVGGKPGITEGKPAKPGPLVLTFYKAMEAARLDLAELSKLGAKVAETKLLVTDKSPTGLRYQGFEEAVKQLAEAKNWDDEDAVKGAFMAFKDRAWRNTWAMHHGSVKFIHNTASQLSGVTTASVAGLDVKKKEEMEAVNAKLRANVASAIGIDGARKAFDGQVAGDKGYADSREGQYHAGQLDKAQASVNAVRVEAGADGKYKIVYTDKEGKVQTARDGIPDLKAADVAAGEVTSEIAQKILEGHPILAKTKAAVDAVFGGDVPPPVMGTPKAAYTDDWGCKKDGETLAEYKKRNASAQMEAAADLSAKRQKAEKVFLDEMKTANEQYENDKKYMKPEQAKALYDGRVKAAKDKYQAATPEGSRDQVISERTASMSVGSSVAEGEFVQLVKDMVPKLGTEMPANLKKGKYDDALGKGAGKILVEPIPAADGSTYTRFDEYYKAEWAGEKLDASAKACVGTFRAGEYDTLEACAAERFAAWLKADGKAVVAPVKDVKPVPQKGKVKQPKKGTGAEGVIDPEAALNDADANR